jgi:sarcosine oxidase, subunit gamma
MADRSLERCSALHGLALPNRIGIVSVAPAGDVARFLYQGAPEAISEAFGVALPTTPMRAARTDAAKSQPTPSGNSGSDGGAGATGRAALWLGPDEWLLLAPEVEHATLAAALGTVAGAASQSLVDISHRQVGLRVSGPRADQLLNAGCPLDLDVRAFPVGMCSRTLLAKADIVLWRVEPDVFHLEVLRSFAPYVAAYLTESARGM